MCSPIDLDTDGTILLRQDWGPHGEFPRKSDGVSRRLFVAGIAAAKRATTISIVMIAVGDLVRTGLVDNLGHPGGYLAASRKVGE